ncbi:indole-3-glycerol phosphate synthase TrpC [Orenia marismortui]|uniref:indole-3-glycerol phosphate synthase TrpC n=1 Tax=Orenia marismortui TaxID=46469 RepID=UPI0003754C4A|nr:indole-3-glycerol phosphate synthase TrpC [Orenia marismortui]
MILDKIVNHKKVEVEKQKQEESLDDLKRIIKGRDNTKNFKVALKDQGMSLIAELKKASPSKGLIRDDFQVVEIAKEYEQAGARALSVLTDYEFFRGSLNYLSEVREAVELPLLRKDFIIDPYQIYQARAYGADAILLIVAILSKEELAKYLSIADDLDLDVLVEVHSRKELNIALEIDTEIIGINNRNLKVFEVDLATTLGLQRLIPDEKVIVSESGIRNRNDIELLSEHRIDGVLVGESLMKSNNITAKVQELINS